jgi:hypothetical protein
MLRIILSLGLVLIITGVWSSAQFTPPSGGGSSSFASLTSGTNTAATMNVGTGASIQPAGSGVVSANQVNGASAPTSKTCVGTNSSGQLIDATSHCGSAGSANIIGAGSASISGGVLSSNNVTGVVASLTRTGTGQYTVSLSGVTGIYIPIVTGTSTSGGNAAVVLAQSPFLSSGFTINSCQSSSNCGTFIESPGFQVLIIQ